MKTILYLLSFIIFGIYSAYAEEWVNIYSNSGDKLQIALPDGFCDISHTDDGQYIINHLNKTKDNASGLISAEAKIVYTSCGQTFGYPWGYIYFNHSKYPPSYTQLEYNKLESSTFNRSYLKDVQKQVNKSHDLNNAEIKIKTTGMPEVIWEDDNALIYYHIMSGNSNGKQFEEVLTGSAILFNNYTFVMFIYEAEGYNNPLKNAGLFLNAAKLTKNR